MTLGSFSLFRGLAEGLTGGVDNFTNFPERFLFLGQGYSARRRPDAGADLRRRGRGVLGACCTGRRSAAAWSRSASRPRGPATPGCRSSGWSALVYLLSGLVASLAAIIYVAHLGQAKADAGTGYELAAITAVVLGGTSIFGGRGSVPGTLLGLFAIAVLQNGLRLADLPAELAGVLTGTLLLVAIGLDRQPAPGRDRRGTPTSSTEVIDREELASGRDLRRHPGGGPDQRGEQRLPGPIAQERATPAATPAPRRREPRAKAAPARPITVAMMPKSKGNAYFIACRKGAEEAAKELGVKLIWDGPTDPDPAKQNEVDRHLDHPRRRRDRRGRREPRGDLVGAAQGPRSAASRSSPGTPTPSPTPATSSSTRPRPRGSARR